MASKATDVGPEMEDNESTIAGESSTIVPEQDQAPSERKQFLKDILQDFLHVVKPLRFMDVMIEKEIMGESDRESILSQEKPKTRKDQNLDIWMFLHRIPIEDFNSTILPYLRENDPHIVPTRYGGHLQDSENLCVHHTIVNKIRFRTMACAMYEDDFIDLDRFQILIQDAKDDKTKLKELLRSYSDSNPSTVAANVQMLLESYRIKVPPVMDIGVCKCLQPGNKTFLVVQVESKLARTQSWVATQAQQEEQDDTSTRDIASSITHGQSEQELHSATFPITSTKEEMKGDDKSKSETFEKQRLELPERSLTEWGKSHSLTEKTMQVLAEEGFDTLEDIALLTPELVKEQFQDRHVLPLQQCLRLTYAMSNLSDSVSNEGLKDQTTVEVGTGETDPTQRPTSVVHNSFTVQAGTQTESADGSEYESKEFDQCSQNTIADNSAYEPKPETKTAAVQCLLLETNAQETESTPAVSTSENNAHQTVEDAHVAEQDHIKDLKETLKDEMTQQLETFKGVLEEAATLREEKYLDNLKHVLEEAQQQEQTRMKPNEETLKQLNDQLSRGVTHEEYGQQLEEKLRRFLETMEQSKRANGHEMKDGLLQVMKEQFEKLTEKMNCAQDQHREDHTSHAGQLEQLFGELKQQEDELKEIREICTKNLSRSSCLSESAFKETEIKKMGTFNRQAPELQSLKKMLQKTHVKTPVKGQDGQVRNTLRKNQRVLNKLLDTFVWLREL